MEKSGAFSSSQMLPEKTGTSESHSNNEIQASMKMEKLRINISLCKKITQISAKQPLTLIKSKILYKIK